MRKITTRDCVIKVCKPLEGKRADTIAFNLNDKYLTASSKPHNKKNVIVPWSWRIYIICFLDLVKQTNRDKKQDHKYVAYISRLKCKNMHQTSENKSYSLKNLMVLQF